MAEASKKTADSAGSHRSVDIARRTGLVQFVREVYREGYQKVSWPSWKETYLTTIMVFVMVGLMMMFFFFVDWLLAMGEGLLLRSAG
ncbi:MAG TPA: preprotein translocase subunit SecE [Rhizomicrobium sp.]|nr:preprotein translocase subunit SecE [Rhizomicrobium sp.]